MALPVDGGGEERGYRSAVFRRPRRRPCWWLSPIFVRRRESQMRETGRCAQLLVTVGLKRHYPARGRVSAGWRPRSGINNAVPSMAGSLEVVRLGLGWDPLMGRRLGPSADEQRASVCARARARCQWRQLANYTGRLHPIADVGHP